MGVEWKATVRFGANPGCEVLAMTSSGDHHSARSASAVGATGAMLLVCLAVVACGDSSNTMSASVHTGSVAKSAVDPAACVRKQGPATGSGVVVTSPNTAAPEAQVMPRNCGVKGPQKALPAKGKPVSGRVARGANEFAECVRRNRGSVPLSKRRVKAPSESTEAIKGKTASVRRAVRVCSHLLG